MALAGEEPASPPWPLIMALVVLVPECISLLAMLLQRSKIGSTVPKELEGIYEPEDYNKSNEYTRAKSTFGLLKDVFDLVVFFSFWFLRGFPFLDSICSSFQFSEIVTGLIFMAIMSVVQTLIGLPWDIYSTFVLEERFGFNKTTPWTFVKDRIKGLALTMLLGGPLLYIVLWFFISAGPNAWLYVFLTITTFQVTLLFLMPVLILPLFMEMISLPEGVAVITGEQKGDGAPAFLFTRVFYAHDEQSGGRPAWVTKDRRFAGSKEGGKLSLHWSDDASSGASPGWVISEGLPDAQGTIYARTTQSPEDATEWSLTDGALALAKKSAENSSEALVKEPLKSTSANVGSLRKRLLELADRLGYTGANIFVIDGSSRSAHSNAFCTGFGRFRRICLFDTLLPLMEESEIIAILGHEIGHDRLYHVHTQLVFSIAFSFVMLYAMGQFITSVAISQAFFVPVPKVYLGLVFFSIAWSPINFVVSIPLTLRSRMNEFAADRYSVDADETHAAFLGNGLKKLMRKSKANLTPHPFFVFLTYSHPPLDIRLEALKLYHKKKHG